MTDGRKDDQGKAPLWHLGYVSGALAQVAKVLEVGGAKYGVENWRKVPDFRNRYASALLRHAFAYLRGEANDPDDGLPHLAHLICCALFLLEGPAKAEALTPKGYHPKVGECVEIWSLDYPHTWPDRDTTVWTPGVVKAVPPMPDGYFTVAPDYPTSGKPHNFHAVVVRLAHQIRPIK